MTLNELTEKEVTLLDQAQLLNYLKITNLTVGLLINFSDHKLTDGIQRIVNKFHESYVLG